MTAGLLFTVFLYLYVYVYVGFECVSLYVLGLLIIVSVTILQRQMLICPTKVRFYFLYIGLKKKKYTQPRTESHTLLRDRSRYYTPPWHLFNNYVFILPFLYLFLCKQRFSRSEWVVLSWGGGGGVGLIQYLY